MDTGIVDIIHFSHFVSRFSNPGWPGGSSKTDSLVKGVQR
jgi:hypothetical protein